MAWDEAINRFLARIPALPLAAGVSIGAMAGCGALQMSWAIVFVLLVILLFFFAKVYYHHLIFLAVGLLASFTLSIYLKPADLSGLLPCENKQYAAEVLDVQRGNSSTKCIVAISSPGIKGYRCYLTLHQSAPMVFPGDSILFKAVLYQPQVYAGVPYMDSYDLASKMQRISASAFVPEGQLEVIGKSNSWYYGFSDAKYMIIDAIYSSPMSEQASSLLVASCFGDGSAPPDLKNIFRATGLSHLLCVSGFHVGIIAALVYLLLMPLKLFPRLSKLRYLFALVLIWAYVAIVGFMPSVLRAAIMISAFTIGKIVEEKVSSVNSLLFAVAIILMLDPYWIFSLGFWLSVCAVSGLIFFSEQLNPVNPRKVWLRKGVALLIVPIAAMLGILPVVAAVFKNVPVFFIPANIAASLVFPVFITIGSVVSLFASMGADMTLLARILDTICSRLIDFCDWLASFSSSQVAIDSLPVVFVVVAVLACALFLNVPHRNVRIVVASVFAISVVLTACMPATNAEAQIIVHSVQGRVQVLATHPRSKKGVVAILGEKNRTIPSYHSFFRAAIGPESDIDTLCAPVITIGPHTFVRPVKYSKTKLIPEACMLVLEAPLYQPVLTLLECKPKAVFIGTGFSRQKQELYADTLCKLGIEPVVLSNAMIIPHGLRHKP